MTCPGFRYHPAVIAHAAATLGAMYPGPLLSRAGRRRGAQRARGRRLVAGGRDPQRDDVRGDRDHQQAVHRQGRQAQGRVLHAGERQALHPTRDSRCPIYVATAGPVNAKKTGKFADGIITVGAADEKIGHALGQVRGRRPRGRQGPVQRRPRCSRSTSPGRAPTRRRSTTRCVEWPNGGMALPQAGHPEPRGLRRRWRSWSGPRTSRTVVLMTQRPRGAHQAHPALRGHGLRRDPPPQRRAQPGRVHRGLRQGGHPEPAPAAEAGSGAGGQRPDAARQRAASSSAASARATAALTATVKPAVARTPARTGDRGDRPRRQRDRDLPDAVAQQAAATSPCPATRPWPARRPRTSSSAGRRRASSHATTIATNISGNGRNARLMTGDGRDGQAADHQPLAAEPADQPTEQEPRRHRRRPRARPAAPRSSPA